MSSDMKQVFEALLPPGAIWRPAPDGDLDHLLDGIGDNAQELYDYLEALSHLRDPRQTTILRDLEKEYGELTNELLPESERRSQLAARKYALPDTASDELFEDKLRALGFDSIIVTQNDPAIDPDLITGELLVNGPIYTAQSPAYMAQAGGANMYAGNGLAVAGYFLTIRRETYDYQIPDDWRYWRYVSFIGGAASGWPGSPAIATYDVDYKKEQALNRAILAIKPEHSWIVLVVDYIMIWEELTVALGLFGHRGIGYGDDKYIILITPGKYTFSTDRENWETRNFAGPVSSLYPSKIIWGNNEFLMVGSPTAIQTSPDAAAAVWTKQTADPPYADAFSCAAWGNDIYVIAGNAGEIQTSPDGITWTHRTPDAGFSGYFLTAVFDKGIFVLAGESGEIQTSPDGINWTQQTAAGSFTGDFSASTFGNGYFLLVGDSAEIQRSFNGVVWEQGTADASYSGSFRAATAGNGIFVIGGASGEIQRSSDGLIWKHEDPAGGFSGLFNGATFGKGFFVMIGGTDEVQAS